jgi:IS5 family transposase
VQQRVSCIHVGRLPDESTILRFRHRLEKYKLAEQILVTVNELLIQRGLLLKAGTVVDATLIAAPTSTKNKGKARDPEMHSSKKGNPRRLQSLQVLPSSQSRQGSFRDLNHPIFKNRAIW